MRVRGVWPGVKLIHGVVAARGLGWAPAGVWLLPEHAAGAGSGASGDAPALAESLVLVHGGMAQNVGPILEMVTERYLLRSPAGARPPGGGPDLDRVLAILQGGSVADLSRATTAISSVLHDHHPWATNLFVESIIERAQKTLGDAYWGFGCSAACPRRNGIHGGPGGARMPRTGCLRSCAQKSAALSALPFIWIR